MAFYLGSNQIDNSNISYYIGSNFYNEENLFLQRQITQFDSNIDLIGSYTFRNCGFLTSVNLPQATSIGNYAFYNCYSLTSVNLPQVTSIGDYAFCYCTPLASINLPQVTTIKSYAFNCCYKLLSLYLLGSSIPSLANINAFSSTPISNDTTLTGGVHGSIYVPASLYSSYLTATNWSIFSSRFVSV